MTNYQKILKRLERKLDRLVRQMLQSGRSQAEIANAAIRLINDFNPYKKLRSQFQSDAENLIEGAIKKAEKQFTWIAEHTRDGIDQKSVNLFTTVNKQFALMQGEIQQKVVNVVKEAIEKDIPFNKLTDMIENATQGGRYQANTIANTSLQGFSRQANNTLAEESGIDEFKYSGPPPERQFCKDLIGKINTKSEILQMNNGQGLSVWVYCGGWNCPHKHEPHIVPAKIELYKQRATALVA